MSSLLSAYDIFYITDCYSNEGAGLFEKNDIVHG